MWTDILASAARFLGLGRLGRSCARPASRPARDITVHAAHADIFPSLSNDEINERFGWKGDRPADSRIELNV